MMREDIKKTIKESLQGLVDAGIKPKSYSERDFNRLGVNLPSISYNRKKIQDIRTGIGVSQAIFAKLLNVSRSSVQSWELGDREPHGSTLVLLDMLENKSILLGRRLKLIKGFARSLTI